MKRERLLKEKEEVIKKIRGVDITITQETRNVGFVSNDHKVHKQKLVNRLEEINIELDKPEPVKKVTPKKTTLKKDVKDEEVGTEEDN